MSKNKLDKLGEILESIQGVDADMITEVTVMLESQIQEQVDERDAERAKAVEVLKEEHEKAINEMVKNTEKITNEIVEDFGKKEIAKHIALLESKMATTVEYQAIKEGFGEIVNTLNKVYPQAFLTESATKEMEATNQALKDMHEQLITEHDQLKADKFAVDKELSLIKLTESLSDINKQRVSKFMNEIEFTSIDEYTKAGKVYVSQISEKTDKTKLDLTEETTKRKVDEKSEKSTKINW